MNVNLNNIQSMPQNIISSNKSFCKDKSAFNNMLAMMMGDKSTAQETLNPSEADNSNYLDMNILELLAGNNINFGALSDISADNKVIYDYISSDKKTETHEDKVKVTEELTEMMNPFNFSMPNVIMPQEMPMSEVNSDILASEFVYSMTPNNYLKTSQDKQNISNTKTEIFNSDKGVIPVVKEDDASAEKLIPEVEGQRDTLKNKIDAQAEVFTAHSPLTENQNIIININDESSQIKSQVLSQVKDKIVFMAEEGPEPGSTIKHVTMELHPASLGKVDIKMTFENNKVTVEIKALNEETQKIISSGVDELAKILGKSSENINILVKSNDSALEHQLYNYNQTGKMNEQVYEDGENNEQGRHKNHYYYEDNKDNKDDEDDSVFSQLINLRSIKLNA